MNRSAFPRWLLSGVLLFAGDACAQAVRVEGFVRDTSGAAVSGAEITLLTRAFSASHTTDGSGNFSFEAVPHSSGEILARARGFAEQRQTWNAASDSPARLEIVLQLAAPLERVVVTATRIETRLSEIAGGAVALSSSELGSTPALLVDDKLRQIPGFTLFRRAGSRTANPTSQGVSLSGLGASGASRALVLEDGVPLKDPFGGWVYWGRIPQQALASVEVVRRGASNLYGAGALGGVIQFFSREPGSPAFSLETSYGTQQTPNLSFWAGGRAGQWDASLAADLFHTDGYILVPAASRGIADTPANSEHATTTLAVGRRFGADGRVFGRGSFYTEARHNGTLLQTNDTRLAQAAVGFDARTSRAGAWSVRLYGSAQGFNQSFSAVAASRMSESLTNQQHVPAQQVGGSVAWSMPLGAVHTLVAGIEGAEVTGSSHEEIFSAAVHTATQVAGGRQRAAGFFGQDMIRITPKWILTAGARVDRWRNFNARSSREPLSPPGPVTVTRFSDRMETAFSPRLSILYAAHSNVSLSAAAYRAFRPPTLNELYRAFRVGNVITQANSDLRAEHLTGAEAGANVFAWGRRLNARGNFFWSEIVNPIANVTLSVTPALITRQRQNIGRTRSRGVELDAVARISDSLQFSAGYQFVDATVVRFPANAALEGLRILQVPRRQLTVQARYGKPAGFRLSVQGRFVGAQFEDDQNALKLERYFTLDLLAGRSLGRGVEAFAAFENLLNRRYPVGLTPVPTLGPPVLARIGLRFNYPAR